MNAPALPAERLAEARIDVPCATCARWHEAIAAMHLAAEAELQRRIDLLEQECKRLREQNAQLVEQRAMLAEV